MKSTYDHPSHSTNHLLLFLPLTLLILAFIFYPNNNLFSIFNSSFLTCSTANDASKVAPPVDDAKLNIFFGILTMPQLHERRHLVRSVYAVQTHNLSTAKVDVRFIFCNYSIQEDVKMFLALEIMLYGDIVLLDCVENMNNGKTYTFFSSLPSLFGNGHDQRPYDYVVKADDDAYFRLDNLALFLKDKPREDLYYGMEMFCDYVNGICGAHNTFMAGFGYVLSWDLVEWIAESDIARNNKTGLEDMMLVEWLNTGGKGKNRYDGVPAMYDYKGNLPEKRDRHDFIPETIAVHQLKANAQWARTLEYFNVTNSLKPSKLHRNFP
ncbi:hypothetical protein LUZ63_018847 [Rhynchospora breviuscula]|uniref:Hexosyltransferase n=1 Tax=Rhynchospora breviuscula TaxID=2022672 RepID=A0A9Q0C575_9POAL|nr:hypothetical protein LUZ63_018847 [Rhynchospora breviuscula]